MKDQIHLNRVHLVLSIHLKKLVTLFWPQTHRGQLVSNFWMGKLFSHVVIIAIRWGKPIHLACHAFCTAHIHNSVTKEIEFKKDLYLLRYSSMPLMITVYFFPYFSTFLDLPVLLLSIFLDTSNLQVLFLSTFSHYTCYHVYFLTCCKKENKIDF